MNFLNIPNTYFGHTIHQGPMIGSMASRKDGHYAEMQAADAAIAMAMGDKS